MIRAGFLSSEDRAELIALARDGSAAHQLARRANALALLDAGWSCEKVAGALLMDDDTIRKWHGLFVAQGLIGLARFDPGGSVGFLNAAQAATLKNWIAATPPRSTRHRIAGRDPYRIALSGPLSSRSSASFMKAARD